MLSLCMKRMTVFVCLCALLITAVEKLQKQLAEKAELEKNQQSEICMDEDVGDDKKTNTCTSEKMDATESVDSNPSVVCNKTDGTVYMQYIYICNFDAR